MSTETEMKLSAVGVTPRQVSEHPEVRKYLRDQHPARHLGNIYFDTPELLLQRELIGLRLRRDGEQWLQTAKTSGAAVGGLHQRGEWEMPVAGEALELDRFDAKLLRKLFDDKEVAASLSPVFRTDFERSTWDLEFDDGTLVELVLDNGEVKAGSRSETISEVELELKQGDSARLFELARALAETLPLRILNASKAARGYRLAGHAPAPVACDAVAIRLHKKDGTEQGFISIMHAGLAHLQANEAVLLGNPDDAGGVSQMLLACDHLRACLAAYEALIPAAASEALVAELGWLSAELEPAQAWGRFAHGILEPLSQWLPAHRDLKTLGRRVQQHRLDAVQAAAEALHSARYSHWLLDIGLWLQRRDWRELSDKQQRRALDKPVGRFAAELLSDRHQRVNKRLGRFDELNGQQRRRLGQRCADLAAISGCFAGMYGRKGSRGYISAVSDLQQALAAFDIAPTALRLLSEVGSGRKAPAADLVTGWLLADQRCDRLRLDSARTGFEQQVAFWKKQDD